MDKLNTKIAQETLNFCKKKFGTPLKRTYPNLVISQDNRYTRRYGDYIDRTITIYLKSCNTKCNIIKTIIHEYTHFLQMPKMNDIKKWHRLHENFNYEDHPYELEAQMSEILFYNECLEYVDKKIKK